MLTLYGTTPGRDCAGLSSRDFLRAGFLGLGRPLDLALSAFLPVMG